MSALVCKYCSAPRDAAPQGMRCPVCQRWGEPVPAEGEDGAPDAGTLVSLSKVRASDAERLSLVTAGSGPMLYTAQAFARAVSGIAKGGVYLLSGDPGCGKSTLTLALAAAINGRSRIVLGEEAAPSVKNRANRLGLRQIGHVEVIEGEDVDLMITESEDAFYLTIVDSLDTLRDRDVAGQPGSAYQKSAVLRKLAKHAKATGESMVVISHVNKDGDFAGGMDLPHLVTCTLHLRRMNDTDRCLEVKKNREGPITITNPKTGALDNAAFYQMTDKGHLVVLD